MAANAPIKDRVIIGIDFGTTFSGVAWAYSGDPDEIELVTSWESELNHCSDIEKCPTQIRHGRENEPITWGYSIPPDKTALKWFKLLLLDDKDVPKDILNSDQLVEARRLQRSSGQDPISIISGFLRRIWSHTLESITRSLGTELLKLCKFHVVITLPAIWPPYAQQRMKKAAKLSGILDPRSAGETVLRFISEPEAAALATLKDLSKRSVIKPGDTMVVCDAGGGTVDLISYVVESTEPFVVKECVKGDGELCGAVFLDERFLNLVKEKVTPEAWEKVSKTEAKRFLNDVWEHGIKPQFQAQDRIWPVDLPPSCRPAAEEDGTVKKFRRRVTLELNTSDLTSFVFDPIITKITALVKRQSDGVQKRYNKPPKYVILVGGFGRSRFLYNRLKNEANPATSILQSSGSKPWTAICRGAVVQGLTGLSLTNNFGVKVEARIARMSYGVRYHATWKDGGRFKECDKQWSTAEQQYIAINQMKWFLKQGDDITDKKPVREEYFRLYSDSLGEVQNTIYCTSELPLPDRFDDRTQFLCTTKWNQDIKFESLPRYTNSVGKIYRKLDYDIELTCDEGTVDFTIYHDGKRVGGQNVEVKYDLDNHVPDIDIEKPKNK